MMKKLELIERTLLYKKSREMVSRSESKQNIKSDGSNYAMYVDIRYFLIQKSEYSLREQWLPRIRSYLKEKVLQSPELFVGFF